MALKAETGGLSKEVNAYVTHGVLSGSTVSKIINLPLKNLVTTDSIKATESLKLASNIDNYLSHLFGKL